MLVPYKTDASIYHWPVATGVLILLNVACFAWQVTIYFSEDIAPLEAAMLKLGDGINPVQWLTSLFMHGDPMHLFGNMMFLWTFGIIVEGKIGWWRFVLCYLSIGMLQTGLVQVLFLWGGEGFVLGASGAIFGIMAMALIWAPMNEVSVFMLIYFYWFTFDVKVVGLAGFFILSNLFIAFLGFFAISSELLHMTGVFFGFPLGLAMVQMRMIDCEGYDLLSILSGRKGQRVKTIQEEREDDAEAKRYEQEKQHAMELGYKQVNQYLSQGHVDMALARFRVLKNYDKSLELSIEQRYEVIRKLHAAKRWKDSIPHMRSYVERGGTHASLMQVKLSQILLVELERPKLTLQTLHEIDMQQGLTDQQRAMCKKLAARAQEMIREGHLEADEPL